MHGNTLLAILTLVIALSLLAPALFAGWGSQRRTGAKRGERSRTGRAGGQPQPAPGEAEALPHSQVRRISHT